MRHSLERQWSIYRLIVISASVNNARPAQNGPIPEVDRLGSLQGKASPRAISAKSDRYVVVVVVVVRFTSRSSLDRPVRGFPDRVAKVAPVAARTLAFGGLQIEFSSEVNCF